MENNSFASASYMNTYFNSDHLYKSVGQRHIYYRWAHHQINSRSDDPGSAWFKAAAIVTDVRAVGGTEYTDFGLISSRSVDKFLKAGNAFLFEHNMDNAKGLIFEGNINKIFTDVNGETIDLSSLRGLELDYALFQFEQILVEEFTTEYFQSNPNIDQGQMINAVNNLFSSPIGSTDVREVIGENFTDESFDFSNYNHRVTLRQRLVDRIRENDNIE